MVVVFSIGYDEGIHIYLLKSEGILTVLLFQSNIAAVSMDKHIISSDS